MLEVKTTKQMLEKAVSICDRDPNSRVVVFFKTHKDLLEAAAGIPQLQIVLRNGSMCYKSRSGGWLDMWYFGNEPIANRVAGMQVTHAFITTWSVSSLDSTFIRSRIRCPHPVTPEPMGLYWPTHVERWEEY